MMFKSSAMPVPRSSPFRWHAIWWQRRYFASWSVAFKEMVFVLGAAHSNVKHAIFLVIRQESKGNACSMHLVSWSLCFTTQSKTPMSVWRKKNVSPWFTGWAAFPIWHGLPDRCTNGKISSSLYVYWPLSGSFAFDINVFVNPKHLSLTDVSDGHSKHLILWLGSDCIFEFSWRSSIIFQKRASLFYGDWFSFRCTCLGLSSLYIPTSLCDRSLSKWCHLGSLCG